MFENRYSFLDRAIHRIAFHTYPAQIAIADVEDRLYAKKFTNCDASRPVFITALPRAGTTLLLELLAGLPEFAAHSYRDMPFVLTPALWSSMSARHQRHEESRERAHGDGVAVGADSPEALEEVLWKVFWKKHYLADRIKPWSAKRNPEFQEFFQNHMRKIIHVRHGPNPENVRYVSKNNPNIARTGLLRRMFPDCSIVVPFRDPLQHAASLLRQHVNFLKIQDEDRFALEYMSAIGHYDFGQQLRRIDFDNWLEGAQDDDASSITFWLEYWVAAYRHLFNDQQSRLNFLSYEQLCENAPQAMRRLADDIDVNDVDGLISRADNIHPPVSREVETSGISQKLMDEARDLHNTLLKSLKIS